MRRACGRYVKPLSAEQEASLAKLKEEQAQVDEHMRTRKTDPVGTRVFPCRRTLKQCPCPCLQLDEPLLEGALGW